MQHSWADIDNDGDLDLYIEATWEMNGINELWKNNGGTGLTLTQNSGSTPNQAQPYQGTLAWVDYDNDGWVDLFIPRWNNQSNRLFHNTGNGNFVEISNAGAIVADLKWTTGGYWGDFDNDNDMDVFVVNYEDGLTMTAGTNDLFRNDGNGVFTKITNAGPVVSTPERGRSATWVDVNNDGWLDLFVCNQFAGAGTGRDQLHINNGDGTFDFVPVGDPGHTSWSANWGDFDNDGDQDLMTLGIFPQDFRVWQNDGAGNLSNVTANYSNLVIGISGSQSQAIVWVDMDMDGNLDLHLTQPEANIDHLYKNMGQPCRSWLEVKCVGQQSNHAAIGTTLRAKASINGSPVKQMRQIVSNSAAVGNNPLWQHFGFHDATIIDTLWVKWPSGKECIFTQLAVNQFIEIKEDCSMETIKQSLMSSNTLTEFNVCQPDTMPIALVITAPSGGIWLNNCGTCLSADGVFHPAGLAPGDYVIRYQEGNICELNIDSFVVHIFPQPIVEASGKDMVSYGEKVLLSGSGAPDLVWSPAGSLSCETCDNPIFTADSTTTFMLIGTDDVGCTDTALLTVVVREQFKVDMPNAFTPNGDQSNDVFKPAFKGNIFDEYHLTIYSRWGEQVFETFNPGEGWDGRINELSASSDVYVYVFEYTMKNGEKDTIPGEVSLIR
jgi:gliding motility-associated-like protein